MSIYSSFTTKKFGNEKKEAFRNSVNILDMTRIGVIKVLPMEKL